MTYNHLRKRCLAVLCGEIRSCKGRYVTFTSRSHALGPYFLAHSESASKNRPIEFLIGRSIGLLVSQAENSGADRDSSICQSARRRRAYWRRNNRANSFANFESSSDLRITQVSKHNEVSGEWLYHYKFGATLALLVDW
jgi:hypothetical protein